MKGRRLMQVETSCISWQGATDPRGYGRKGKGTREERYVHRAAWVRANGEIPEKMQIHHLCGNRLCLNVEHMVLLTHSEHTRIHAYEKWQPGGALRERDWTR